MKPLILVTNDDGVFAPGLAVLAEVATEFGEVVVCAPETERSGSSQAITLHTHLRAHPVRDGWWRISGTPVDCVYLAVHHLCERRPALVVSGINAGYNLGGDVFYSGTVGAAAEGYLRGIPAIAFSTEHHVDPNWAVPVARQAIDAVLREGRHQLLNVNVPGRPGHAEMSDPERDAAAGDLQVEVTRLGSRVYEELVEPRTDPMGRLYYWIGGPPVPGMHREGDDTHAVASGNISITPIEMDLNAADLEPTRRMFQRVPPR